MPSGRQQPRVLHRPEFDSEDDARDAVDVMAMCGQILDPWQVLLVCVTLATMLGRLAASTVGALVARQNGKGGWLETIAIWSLFEAHLTGRVFGSDPKRPGAKNFTLWTAHELKTSDEAYLRVKALIQANEDLAAEVVRWDGGLTGQHVIELRDGSRLAFLARSKSSGRGFSPRRVIFDESQEFTALAHRAMLYATSAQGEHRQLIYTGTVPSEENNSEIWTGIRDVGRKGESKRAAWAEWTPKGSDDPRATIDPTSWTNRAWSNPALGTDRLLHETIDAEWEAAQSDIEGFLRERLSIWPTLTDADIGGAFPANVWANAASDDEGVRISTRPIVCLDVRTGMQQSYAIVAAGGTEFGYDMVAVARYVNDGSRLTNEEIVADALEVLEARGMSSIVLDKYGENQHLRPLFEEAGIDVILLDTLDMKGGCVGFSAGILNGTVKHLQVEPYPLTASQKGAVLHNGLWSWKYSTSDLTALRAATAAWWVHHNTPDGVVDLLETIY